VMIYEHADTYLSVLRGKRRIEFYNNILDELEEMMEGTYDISEGQTAALAMSRLGGGGVKTYKLDGPVHRPAPRRKFGPPTEHPESHEVSTAAKKHKECRKGVAEKVKRHFDYSFVWKNNATSARAPLVCASDKVISVREHIHSPHTDDTIMKAHTDSLYKEVHSMVSAHKSRHGHHHIEITTSNPHAKSWLSGQGEEIRKLGPKSTYKVHSSQFAPPILSDSKTDTRSPLHRPDDHAQCIRCNDSKPRYEFKRKTFNEKLRKEHQHYQIKPTCKPCDNEQKKTEARTFRKAAIEWRGGSCSHCGLTDHSKLELDHVHEDNKLFSISRAGAGGREAKIAELRKTVPLCKTCHKSKTGGNKDVHASAQRRLSDLESVNTEFPIPKKQRGGNQRKPKLAIESQKTDPSDAEMITDPADAIEPFNGLAVRTGDDKPTILRFNPTRVMTTTKGVPKTQKKG
jgi:hypothetical protein